MSACVSVRLPSTAADLGQVLSPMQAIHDYETAHGIPHNCVNYAISRSFGRADSAWPRLERGEMPLYFFLL